MPKPAKTVFVAWRDEYGSSGQTPVLTCEQADATAREFKRPGAWAVVICARRFIILSEYGIRFASLQAVVQWREPSHDASLCRKPPGVARQAGEQKARVISAGAAGGKGG